jgi:hypothetical protein
MKPGDRRRDAIWHAAGTDAPHRPAVSRGRPPARRIPEASPDRDRSAPSAARPAAGWRRGWPAPRPPRSSRARQPRAPGDAGAAGAGDPRPPARVPLRWPPARRCWPRVLGGSRDGRPAPPAAGRPLGVVWDPGQQEPWLLATDRPPRPARAGAMACAAGSRGVRALKSLGGPGTGPGAATRRGWRGPGGGWPSPPRSIWRWAPAWWTPTSVAGPRAGCAAGAPPPPAPTRRRGRVRRGGDWRQPLGLPGPRWWRALGRLPERLPALPDGLVAIRHLATPGGAHAEYLPLLYEIRMIGACRRVRPHPLSPSPSALGEGELPGPEWPQRRRNHADSVLAVDPGEGRADVENPFEDGASPSEGPSPTAVAGYPRSGSR